MKYGFEHDLSDAMSLQVPADDGSETKFALKMALNGCGRLQPRTETLL